MTFILEVLQIQISTGTVIILPGTSCYFSDSSGKFLDSIVAYRPVAKRQFLCNNSVKNFPPQRMRNQQ
jgi:hypothetical protein